MVRRLIAGLLGVGFLILGLGCGGSEASKAGPTKQLPAGRLPGTGKGSVSPTAPTPNP